MLTGTTHQHTLASTTALPLPSAHTLCTPNHRCPSHPCGPQRLLPSTCQVKVSLSFRLLMVLWTKTPTVGICHHSSHFCHTVLACYTSGMRVAASYLTPCRAPSTITMIWRKNRLSVSRKHLISFPTLFLQTSESISGQGVGQRGSPRRAPASHMCDSLGSVSTCPAPREGLSDAFCGQVLLTEVPHLSLSRMGAFYRLDYQSSEVK